MKINKIIKSLALLIIFIYFGLYLLFVKISILPYKDMDFNHSGIISLSETFRAIDVGERDITFSHQTCKEYFDLKDGLGIAVHCETPLIADLVIVNKSKHTLHLSKNGTIYKTYHISLGGNPVGHKVQEGDQKTPEGNYTLDYKKSDSAFYKAIHISYPNKIDKLAAEQLGVSPGGFIMIHGQKNGLGWLSMISQRFDWTNGCIAVNNSDMDEIWDAVDKNTPIEIQP